MKKILFVCLGNICRSPSAEGVFADLLQQQQLTAHYQVDSAATMDYHIGKPPDPRSVEAMQAAGIDISQQRARLFTSQDFLDFDQILVMDERNLTAVLQLCPAGQEKQAKLLMEFFAEHPLDYVPDPFHGQQKDFTEMVELLFQVCSKALTAYEQERLGN